MQDPQTASWFFFGPVAAAYLAICAAWLEYDRLRHLSGGEPPLARSQRPVVDFVLTLVAAGGILLLGSAYRHGWLLPSSGDALGRLFWTIDNAIIYSPIAVVLVVRRQGPETIYLSRHRWAEKIALGLGLGVLAMAIYLALRGELAQLPGCLAASVESGKLVNFVPIFLEGVAIAFGYVRLRWLVGMAAALAIPSILFAVAHIPGQIADERTLSTIGAFFVFNSALCAAILWTVQRSRDVIWIGMAHYLMDIAIRAI